MYAGMCAAVCTIIKNQHQLWSFFFSLSNTKWSVCNYESSCVCVYMNMLACCCYCTNGMNEWTHWIEFLTAQRPNNEKEKKNCTENDNNLVLYLLCSFSHEMKRFWKLVVCDCVLVYRSNIILCMTKKPFDVFHMICMHIWRQKKNSRIRSIE